MRGWLAIFAALMLGGCNMAHSDHPLFTEADAVGAPTFRPGVWASPDPGCAFDPNLPVQQWPGCAHGDIGLRPEPGGSILLIAGRPLLLELGGRAGADAPTYVYVAVEPLRFDAEGRIVAMTVWPVQCGPPPRGRGARKAPRGASRPLPGMVMDADGNNCSTNSADAVRAAAGPSRAWSQAGGVAVWVRDGDH